MATYFVLGTDNREYGPVTTEELRKWIGEGRADAQTKVRVEGTTNWVPLAQVPEFADAPARKAASPPPIRLATPAGKSSGLAIASLVLGICGVFSCGGTALFGLVLGIIALARINNSRGEVRGKGNALAGIIISAITLLMIVPLMAAIAVPNFIKARQISQQNACINNERRLAAAVQMYASEHKDQFPPAATWCDEIRESVDQERAFRCVVQPDNEHCGYAFNAKLDGLEISKADPHTVMLFESDKGWNAHGGAEIESPRHHEQSMVVTYVDGTVELIPESQVRTLRWDP